tara:strand:- start:1286 stop:1507 length:222 start_codon:yes stop_codon:yes gene_type:complete
MKDKFVDALKAKYEAEIKVAKATIEVYFDKPVGVGEHSQFVEEIDKQLEIVTCARDKIKTIDDLYPNEDDIPF